MKRGFDILRDKTLYRSIQFTRGERRRLGLEGLLPYKVATQRERTMPEYSARRTGAR